MFRIQINFFIALLFLPFFAFSFEEESIAALETSEFTIDTVVHIDREKRTLTLRNKAGEESMFTAGAEVDNFDQILFGNQVMVQYYNAFATEIVEDRVQAGEKPNVKNTQIMTANGTVEMIDPKNRQVTIRGVEQTLIVNMSKGINLEPLVAGDQVDVSYIQSYAMAVTPVSEVSGKVTIDSTSIAAGIGMEWGTGELLMYDGTQYTFDIGGISVLDVGISLLTIEGSIYNLFDAKDMEGKYWAAEMGISYGNGVSALTMRNGNDVVLYLTSKQKGMKATLANKGLKITNLMPVK